MVQKLYTLYSEFPKHVHEELPTGTSSLHSATRHNPWEIFQFFLKPPIWNLNNLSQGIVKKMYFLFCQLFKYLIMQKGMFIIRLIIYGKVIGLMRYFFMGKVGWCCFMEENQEIRTGKN